MTLQKRFGLLLAGLLVAAPALYSADGAAEPKRHKHRHAQHKHGHGHGQHRHGKHGHGHPPGHGHHGHHGQGHRDGNKPGGIETAVLVLDASGSMNDRIGHLPRMKIAQDAVRRFLNHWDHDVPLGLTAYGHRSQSCEDIETIVPVRPVERHSFLSAVNELQARGATPLSQAIMSAAEQLDYTENQATIILVSDGEESCGADPCAMAAELERKAVDLTVHVVGFGVNHDVGERKLACIARNTGGQYRTAFDAASLADALGGMGRDVRERKGHWRQRWGQFWGKNGRWQNGWWVHGKPAWHDHKHAGRRKHWRKN